MVEHPTAELAAATARPTVPGHALLTGGGSGGHIFPALSVGEELRRRGWTVSFAGSPFGPEARLVPAHGLPFHGLAARPVLGRGLLAKVRAGLTLLRSAFQARSLVRRQGVDVVVSTGGYASAPAVVGAWLARRPVVLVEPNAGAGLANRQLSRLAKGAAVNHPSTAAQLHCPAEDTGAPVRSVFFDVPPLTEEAAARPHLLVLGGSQGAQQLNRWLPPVVAELVRRNPALRVTHQCGERNQAEAEEAYRAEGLLKDSGTEGPGSGPVTVTPFIDDVAGAMAAATLLVSRSGALTLAEICASGRPSLLVPLSVALGHQGDNARLVAEAGAARVATEEDAFRALLAELLVDPPELVRMGAAARRMARPDAAARIADLAERLATGSSGTGGGA